MQMKEGSSTETKSEGDQWVLFSLGDEEYAVLATQVQEIVRDASITLVPNMPQFVKGICNLRGKIVPILDLKERFGIHKQADLAKARIIIAHLESQMVGFTVDSVLGVLRISPDLIEGVPSTLPKVDVEYLTGVAKLPSGLVLLLSIDRILSKMEKLILESTQLESTNKE